MKRNPSRQYHGAFDDFDLIISRGSAYYRRNPDHAEEMKANIYICQHHANELGHKWSSLGGHIRYHRTTSMFTNHFIFSFRFTEEIVMACSYPIEPHNRHINRRGTAFYLTREEAKSYLKASGIHLHVGLRR